MNNDIKKMYEKYVIKSFCENYNITKKELNDNSHFYFRFLCFLYLDFIRNVEIPKINLGSRYETVFIEFRIFPHVEFIIRNIIIKLGSNCDSPVP